LDASGYNLRTILFVAVKIALPLAMTQPSFDEHLPAFLEIFGAGQGESPDDHDSMPIHAFLAFALFVDVALSVAREKFTTGRPLGV
jgi:hypothetical protein